MNLLRPGEGGILKTKNTKRVGEASMARTLPPEVKVLREMTRIILDYQKVSDNPQDRMDLYGAMHELKDACDRLGVLLVQADTFDQERILRARKTGKVVSIEVSEKFKRALQEGEDI